MSNEPERDTLIFQIDLWNTRGETPLDIADVLTRQKEIQYASRTRASTDTIRRLQRVKNAASVLLSKLPSSTVDGEIKMLQQTLHQKVCRIVHLIYHAKPHHSSTKDFVFAHRNVIEHWETGYVDAVRTLRHPEALSRPTDPESEGVETFDVAVDGRG
jgi:NTE family protein